MATVFGSYDQGSLDEQYDNRAKVGAKLKDYLSFYATQSLLTRATLPASLNVSYGPSGPETLDIFPGEGDGPLPVQLFIHGGYWKALDAKDFSYVARAFQSRGILTLVLNYGFLPGISMAELVAQCARAVVWTYRNITEFGGDPERIFISGHSAGGHLAAMMLMTDWQSLSVPQDVIKGAVGISGLYDLEPVKLCFINEDLKLTADDVARFSPVCHAPGTKAPLLLTVGAEEGPEYLRQSADLAAAWSAAGIHSRSTPMEGHNHFSIIEELNDPGSALAQLMCEQMGVDTD